MGDVVQISDFTVSKRNSKHRAYSENVCLHYRLELDDNGQIVTCLDCQKQITPYFALNMMIESFDRQADKLALKKKELEDLESQKLHFIAAKALETAWRSKTTLPTCPHCNKAIEQTARFGVIDKRFLNK
ncbi:MAG: hypothetical protein IPM57_10790 [Oligoflexia bacterium]|nr:hypothetical protein [Oligoflexia bacterium]